MFTQDFLKDSLRDVLPSTTNTQYNKYPVQQMHRTSISLGTATKEDKSSTGRVWVAGFHRVTARSRLAHVLKFMNRLFI
jgi:hypothetical protein